MQRVAKSASWSNAACCPWLHDLRLRSCYSSGIHSRHINRNAANIPSTARTEAVEVGGNDATPRRVKSDLNVPCDAGALLKCHNPTFGFHHVFCESGTTHVANLQDLLEAEKRPSDFKIKALLFGFVSSPLAVSPAASTPLLLSQQRLHPLEGSCRLDSR